MDLQAILLDEKPSHYFEDFREKNLYTEELKELYTLITIEQNPVFHPEGSVWNHTMMVLDEAAKYKMQAGNPYGFMLAALCHDFGKAVTTEVIDGRIRSYDHEKAGIPLAEKFMERFGVDKETRVYACNLVELHMKPNALVREQSSVRATNRMYRKALDTKALILLAKADHQGRKNAGDYAVAEQFLQERLEKFEELKENNIG
ncbi:MAG: HD domain-containing protein [Ruminococcus sp.]|nr:HD domain-containing protein [Ruminococcus sp.]